MEWTRRKFLKATAAAGGSLAASGFLIGRPKAANDAIHPDPRLDDPMVKTIRSACMMCNAGCGIQVRVRNGVAVFIEGNPYCPQTNDYTGTGGPVTAADIPDPLLRPGRLCARGNGGLATVYNPYRVLTPLKRVGPRGSGQWESISWKTLFDELVDGGILPDATGNGTYAFEGLRAIRGEDAPYAAARGNLTAEDTAYAAEAKGGDPAWYGRKANQYVWIRGRDQIAQVTKRFNDSYGTVNHIEHSSLCNTGWSTAAKHTFFSWSAGNYTYARADLTHVDYLLLVGTNPLEANVGTPYWARKLMDLKARGGRLIVVDPWFNATAAKADLWIPIRPGTDMAFLYGLLRHIADQGRLPEDYLKVCHPGLLGSEWKNWTAASYLVFGEEHEGHFQPEGYLTDKAAGLGVLTTLHEAVSSTSATTIRVVDASALPSRGVILLDGEIISYAGKTDQGGFWDLTGCKRGIDTSAATHAAGTEVVIPYTVFADGRVQRYFEPSSLDGVDSRFEGTVEGHWVQSSLRLLLHQAEERTLEEWGALCDVPAATIAQVAEDLSDPGRKAAVEAYRGSTQQTNGTETGVLVNILNIVLGRVDRVGGYCVAKRFGVKEANEAGNRAVTSGLTAGVRIDRAGKKYEGTLPRPTRMWYPVPSLVSQEAIVSAAQGYPYRVKALSLYCYDPAYNTPNSLPVEHAMQAADEAGRYRIPLAFSSTLFLDETAALCDYVIPDSSYLERFSWPFTSYPTVKTRSATIRRPVIGRYKEIVIEGRLARIYLPYHASLEGSSFATVDDLIAAWSGPMPYDEFLIQLAKKLQLPNFGRDDVATGVAGAHIDTAWQLWDFVARKGDFPQGLDNEGRDGQPGSFDTLGGYMDLGGRWEDPAVIADPASPAFMKNRYGDCLYLFREKPVHYTNPFTGEHLHGIPTWEPPGLGLKGTRIDPMAEGGFDLRLNTAKMAWQVQSRSTNNEWLLEIARTNYLLVHPQDAESRFLKTGDTVWISSPTCPQGTRAVVRVTGSVRPGTVFLHHHFGRRAAGAVPTYVNGSAQRFDRRIGAGTAANLVIEGDPDFPDLPYTDILSGGACYSTGFVKVMRA